MEGGVMEEGSLKAHQSYRGKCWFCQKTFTERFSFHNMQGNSFIYLPKGEGAHFECYVNQCIQKELDRINPK